MQPRYPAGMLALAVALAVTAMIVGLFTGGLMTYLDAIIIALLGFLVMAKVGMKIARSRDVAWLPAMVAGGYIAKILYSTVRFGVLEIFYHGSGDAVGYHGSGIANAELWRSFQVPSGMDLSGTMFVDGISGLIYVPYVPTMIGGFFMFATIAFVGQLFMYAAFRASSKPRRLKWYAIVVFFLPAITYWPASIGKESLMFLGIGMAAYGSARVLNRGGIAPMAYIAAGLAFAGAIRPHVSATIIGSLALALLLAKGKTGLGMGSLQRWVAVVVIGAASLFGAYLTLKSFNISTVSPDALATDVGTFTETVGNATDGGDSAISGGFITSPLQFPGAALTVLFRPLIYEAHNATALASALECTTLLLIVLWRSPKIIRNLFRVRNDPYILMCIIMVFGFVVMFSSFLNLGLLARERSQILPFLAAVVIQLGWNFKEEDVEPEPEPEVNSWLQPV